MQDSAFFPPSLLSCASLHSRPRRVPPSPPPSSFSLLPFHPSSVYTFGPTFRAENSNTTRHLAEFWMIEPELAFADLNDDMNCAEDYVRFCCKTLLDECADDLAFISKQASALPPLCPSGGVAFISKQASPPSPPLFAPLVLLALHLERTRRKRRAQVLLAISNPKPSFRSLLPPAPSPLARWVDPGAVARLQQVWGLGRAKEGGGGNAFPLLHLPAFLSRTFV